MPPPYVQKLFFKEEFGAEFSSTASHSGEWRVFQIWIPKGNKMVSGETQSGRTFTSMKSEKIKYEIVILRIGGEPV